MRATIRVFNTLAAFLCLSANVQAETVTLTPAADTTLHEKFPSHNVGGHFDVAAGGVASGERTRALLRFDLNGKIPGGATLTSAKVTVRVTRQPSGGGPGSVFELRRVNRPWTEGSKKSASGEPASEGEATWQNRMHPSAAWSSPGGAAGVDFAEQPSGFVEVSDIGFYTFASTPQLIEDLQAWRTNPQDNYGWVLLCRDETVRESARRFASREDPANAPVLTIEYAAGLDPLRIQGITVDASNLRLNWTGGVSPFQVQQRLDLLASAWENIGAATTNRSVEMPITQASGFFRIVQAGAVSPPPDNPGPPPAGNPPTNPPAEPPPTNAAETVEYEVVFRSDWSASSHPREFPLGAHWSPLVGGTHNAQVAFWQAGALATRGLEDVAELGSVVALRNEILAAIEQKTAFNVFTRPGSIPANGRVSTRFSIHRDYPLVTLVTMIAPSPDWFTGVHGLSLRENGQWVSQREIVLHLYDAGTDSGSTYNSLDADTQPRERIHQITDFPALVNGQLVPFGTFTFTRLE